MTVFIGGAWPYANGSLHLGHLVALLPGDVLARYYRLKGEDVLYVSGSDCNGTPIAIRARQENVDAQTIADRYHQEFVNDFKRLGFTYDLYTRTDASFHHEIVQKIFLKLKEKGYLYIKSSEQTFCATCNQFLPDRFVEGECPNCGNTARGDQCDYCSAILDPVELVNKRCKICGGSPTIKATEHFYFKLSQFQPAIANFLELAKENHLWRENAIGLTERYVKEGLPDRAATRDLPIGVPVPVQGFEEKKIYVWIEAVSGYLSATIEWAKKNNRDWRCFWQGNVSAYYVHGKDNIPFHTIIWPAILEGLGVTHQPDRIISSEFLTIEKKKLSTSRNWAIWVADFLRRYEPDSLRYFLIANGPETRDADFSWRAFIYSHNGELLGAFGNLVQRTFKFIEKSYEGMIPHGQVQTEIEKSVRQLYADTGRDIENGHFKKALDDIFAFIRSANKFFDSEAPWRQIREDPEACDRTLATCCFIIANLANLLDPFLPFSAKKIRRMLGLGDPTWAPVFIPKDRHLDDVKPLFERIDTSRIDEEKRKLGVGS
ncbi:methionine--tRNA ligase [Camelliibacillus cellulosilyticus]|uniref:Methionine--tRNA ligase n=1 Tax=Camelliibacillus cellulosilyticus TaxID=2174486 RepID=A0ABV9GMV6_9BACL